MRTTQRDKRTIWYALYKGVTDAIDTYGNYTGEHPTEYYPIQEARMNVSGGRGSAEIELFGIDNPFTRTAVTDDLKTNFGTDTVFWFDTDPLTETPNYRCTGVARTVNQVVIALAEVGVSHEDNHA